MTIQGRRIRIPAAVMCVLVAAATRISEGHAIDVIPEDEGSAGSGRSPEGVPPLPSKHGEQQCSALAHGRLDHRVSNARSHAFRRYDHGALRVLGKVETRTKELRLIK
jgi:hypothetical protein